MADLGRIGVPKPTPKVAANALSRGLEGDDELVHIMPAEAQMLADAGFRPQLDPESGVLRFDDAAGKNPGYGAWDNGGDSMANLADVVGSAGRNGDKMAAVTGAKARRAMKQRGGSGTTNPATGLREFFTLDEGSDAGGAPNSTETPAATTNAADTAGGTTNTSTPTVTTVPKLTGGTNATPTVPPPPPPPPPPAAATDNTSWETGGGQLAGDLPFSWQTGDPNNPTFTPAGTIENHTPAPPRSMSDLDANTQAYYKDLLTNDYESRLGRTPEQNADLTGHINRFLNTPGATDAKTFFDQIIAASPEGQAYAHRSTQPDNNAGGGGAGFDYAGFLAQMKALMGNNNQQAVPGVSNAPLAASGSFTPNRLSRLTSSRFRGSPAVNVVG